MSRIMWIFPSEERRQGLRKNLPTFHAIRGAAHVTSCTIRETHLVTVKDRPKASFAFVSSLIRRPKCYKLEVFHEIDEANRFRPNSAVLTVDESFAATPRFLVSAKLSESRMQKREFNRATFRVANTTDMSGRATADEINRGLRIAKGSKIWRIASLTFFGSLTVAGLLVAGAPLPAHAERDEDSRHGHEDNDKGIRDEFTALQAQVAALQSAVSTLQTANSDQQNEIKSLQTSNAKLQNKSTACKPATLRCRSNWPPCNPITPSHLVLTSVSTPTQKTE
jgi:hypothetical protein